MGNFFDIDRFYNVIPKILPYLNVTFHVVLVSMGIGTLLAIFVAVLRIQRIPVVQQSLGVYISFMRGTPLLVQMMISYYGLPLLADALFGMNISRWDTLIFVNIAFILNEGAFLGEIFRSAILSIPAVQSEAGYSIGMTRFQTFTRIVLPQTIKVIIPAYGADLIGVFHNTSLVFMIGVVDIMGRAKTLGTATGHSLEGYVFVALIYIVISLMLKGIFYLVDRKMQYGRR